jgi:hypothetical protein
MTETISYTLDVERLIADLGGATACQRRLERMGVKISVATVRASRKRGYLTQDRLCNLLAHQALFGKAPIDIYKYLIRRDGLPDQGQPRRGGPPSLWIHGSRPAPASPRASAASR